ncbi:MAG: DNA polymerase IV [Euryarchaeota archaeon]|nr:DNA polymerase IV [Euryarchaeota archaeon]MDE1835425.1 DNA polymerase IV [Euryarchaeota archaeon]MDE1879561.1 DNA polymerase IV [Euryarchaeota archaeon]MDE2046076.1 DNA polymerase IV [Thermoplasmata archaeon]
MDAFYVSCELKRRPELKGQPVAVSADPKGGKGRGVVLSASYEARKFGLRSALPVSQAYALCPSYIWVLPDFPFYEENSKDVMALLTARSPQARTFSIDEAAYPWEGGDPAGAEREGRELQKDVRERFDLPCSIGIGPSLTVAKIASDRAKPGGVVVVPPDSVRSFLASLPTRAIPGIGKVTEEELARVGVATIGQMAELPVERLRKALGAMAPGMSDLARGVVREEPWPDEEGPRSMGAMSTFDTDSSDPKEVREEVDRLARALAESVQRQGRRFRTVTLRVRRSDFQQLQRSRTLPQRTENTETLVRGALQLLDQVLSELAQDIRTPPPSLEEPPPTGPPRSRPARWGIRTVGVSVADLAEGSPSQKSLDRFASD